MKQLYRAEIKRNTEVNYHLRIIRRYNGPDFYPDGDLGYFKTEKDALLAATAFLKDVEPAFYFENEDFLVLVDDLVIKVTLFDDDTTKQIENLLKLHCLAWDRQEDLWSTRIIDIRASIQNKFNMLLSDLLRVYGDN